MLNAEKYEKEILDTAQEGYYFAVTKDRQNITRCCSSFKCENCIFYGEDISGCNCSRIKWLLSEYKEPIKLKLTKLEYDILKHISDNTLFMYITRDEDGEIYIFEAEPRKVGDWWYGRGSKYMGIFNELFQFVQWEDEEPTSIQDILNNCEVEDDR